MRDLGDDLEVPVEEARLARGWERIEARAFAKERWFGPPPARLVGLGAVAALVVAVVWARPWGGSGPLHVNGEAPARLLAAAAAAGSAVELDDGSRIGFAAGSVVEALENRGDRFRLLLERGEARFSVEPEGPRRWTIEAGLVTVEVVGTVFTVRRDETEAQVDVERGRVLVRSDRLPDRVRALGAGESVRVRLPDESRAAEGLPRVDRSSSGGASVPRPGGSESSRLAEIADARTGSASWGLPGAEPSGPSGANATDPMSSRSSGQADTEGRVRAPSERAARTEGHSTEDRSRRGPDDQVVDGPAGNPGADDRPSRESAERHAASGRVGEEPEEGASRTTSRAFEAGPEEDTPQRLTAADLLASADMARRAGDVYAALAHLRRAAALEGDPEAALASFTRARLALRVGRAQEAVEDLRRALRLGLPRTLEESARHRLVTALAQAGDEAGARRAADDYLRRYPAGTFRAEVEGARP